MSHRLGFQIDEVPVGWLTDILTPPQFRNKVAQIRHRGAAQPTDSLRPYPESRL